jgi:triosephosphate isomerase (TIM)
MHLQAVGGKLSVGAQSAYFETKGAYTGAISASMLVSAGCKYCLVGHSERRKIFQETDSDINKIVKKLLGRMIRPDYNVRRSDL